MKKYISVDDFYDNQEKWKAELDYLRSIFQKTELVETLKWGMPTYCLNGKNIIGVGAFKNHFGIWFFNGALLKDSKKILQKAQTKTQAMRQMKFTASTKIDETVVLEYVLEAIENEKQGKTVKRSKSENVEIPQYFLDELKKNEKAAHYFNEFTPSKKRDYILCFEEAKTEATRNKRIATALEWIAEGKPRNWKYMKQWK